MHDAPPRTESSVLAPLIDEVEAAMDDAIRERPLPAALRDAILYAVLGGGKRLRPALVLLGCEAVGGRRSDAMPAAIAIELIHNFSLVHDDLPSMDDDAMRRGRPTLHVHAGEAMATLAGDAMVSIAFELLTAAPATAAALVRELGAATTAMIAGQVYDTLGGIPAALDPQQALELVHRNKTGALLRAACRMGGVCGGADAQAMDALTDYGEQIGLMFQIVDDLLDVTQSAEHIGKATGKDLQAGKLTSPGVLGLDRSRDEVQRLRHAAHQALAPLDSCADALRCLGDELAVRTK